MEVAKQVVRALSEPFYAIHTIIFLSYFIARQAATTYSSHLFRDHLFRRELQALLTLGVLLCIKAILILLACILDRRLAAWYLMIFAVIFLLCQQPSFKGLGNVVQMTPLQLENQLSDANSPKGWLIEFRAVWSSRCIQTSQVFTNLSVRYSTEDLYFGSVDLGRFPKAGEKYCISLGVNMGQLPTYVLFQGGCEVSRLPHTSSDGNIMAEFFSESTIANYFELDRRLILHLSKKFSRRILSS